MVISTFQAFRLDSGFIFLTYGISLDLCAAVTGTGTRRNKLATVRNSFWFLVPISLYNLCHNMCITTRAVGSSAELSDAPLLAGRLQIAGKTADCPGPRNLQLHLHRSNMVPAGKGRPGRQSEGRLRPDPEGRTGGGGGDYPAAAADRRAGGELARKSERPARGH
jgi:hypothetical protein